MATAVLVVTCPECEKKFKPKSDMSGKKIRCPFCEEVFVVPKAKGDKAKPDANPKQMKAKAADEEAPQVKDAPQAKAPVDEYDADPDPYGVKNVDLVPRCPNCTQEMGEHDTICLSCGYNTMTRQWGKTAKTYGVTGQRQFLHMLPALGSVVFVLAAIITLLFYYTVFPYWVANTWMEFLDSEAMRMWTTLAFFFIAWAAGMYCFNKFIEKPIPDEIEME